ncbi:MAG: hypothetical protein MUF54_05535, partial [Polyangiaceae bacterium]|nr:hypothetical protein [Polyangiaceae bacterium]
QDTVFIWGFEPHIYDAARRRPATRFIYNVAQRVTWENQWAKDGLIQDLRRNTPRVVIIERGDVFPSVTGNSLDSQQSLQYFPELDQLLRKDYIYADSIQDFDLHMRRSD